jgi:hypothetical protein
MSRFFITANRSSFNSMWEFVTCFKRCVTSLYRLAKANPPRTHRKSYGVARCGPRYRDHFSCSNILIVGNDKTSREAQSFSFSEQSTSYMLTSEVLLKLSLARTSSL